MLRASKAQGELFGRGGGEVGTTKLLAQGSPRIHAPSPTPIPERKKKERGKEMLEGGFFFLSLFLLAGRKVASHKNMLSRK